MPKSFSIDNLAFVVESGWPGNRAGTSTVLEVPCPSPERPVLAGWDEARPGEEPLIRVAVSSERVS